MLANMNKFKGLVFSQGVMLKLTQKGVKREDAYKVVQSNAMKTKEDLSSKTVAELKDMAKAKGIEGISAMKKAELIAALS